MSISLKTHKLLWGKSGNMCAFPDCRKKLVISETETDDFSLIGDEAHIVAKSPNGPRGDFEMDIDYRDKFNNLILLCKNHHKLIDDQPVKYSVEILREIKTNHLNWVEQNLTPEEKNKQISELLYVNIIQQWIEKSYLDYWLNWTSYLFAVNPEINTEIFDDLSHLNEYLFTRFWPSEYPQIEDVFENFRLILNDLLEVFRRYTITKEYFDDDGNLNYTTLWTDTFYRVKEGITISEKEYYKRVKDWEYHVGLVHDLTLELTRAANLIIGLVRRTIYSNFREQKGVLTVTIGLQGDIRFRHYHVRYTDYKKQKYRGLKEFMEDRMNRDYSFGSGISEGFNEYFEMLKSKNNNKIIGKL